MLWLSETAIITISLSSNNTSYNIVSSKTGSYVCLPNTDYWFKVEFTGTAYNVYYSTDGVTWNLDITIASSTAIKQASSWLLGCGAIGGTTTYYNTHSIDLNETYWEINGGDAIDAWYGTNTFTVSKNSNGHIFYDIKQKEKVDEFYNKYGVAWFYGVDTENERILLPRNAWFDQLTNDVLEVGLSVEAGLPNITGGFGVDTNAAATASGAFYKGSSGNKAPNHTDDTDKTSGYSIDAYRCSTIYGNSDTVQPIAVKKLAYMVVGNTSTENAVTDVIDVTTTENDTLPLFHNFWSKEDMTTTGCYVNASLGSWLSGNVYTTAYNTLVQKLGTSNVKSVSDTYTDYDFVVNADAITFRLPLLNGDRVLVAKKEATETDSRWYNLYSDGWLEQGGVATGGSSDAGAEILLLKEYNSTNYTLSASGCTRRDDAFTNASATVVRIRAITTKSFYASTVWVSNSSWSNASYDFSWEAKGYVSSPRNTDISLYYKVANAVQNLQLLDVAKIENTKADKTAVDGQWVVVNDYPVLTSATAVGDYTIDISDYLPNDGYTYEVMIRVFGYNSTTTDKQFYVGTDLLPITSEPRAPIYSVVDSDRCEMVVNSTCLFTLNKSISAKITGGALTEFNIRLIAYRRIGRNQ